MLFFFYSIIIINININIIVRYDLSSSDAEPG